MACCTWKILAPVVASNIEPAIYAIVPAGVSPHLIASTRRTRMSQSVFPRAVRLAVSEVQARLGSRLCTELDSVSWYCQQASSCYYLAPTIQSFSDSMLTPCMVL